MSATHGPLLVMRYAKVISEAIAQREKEDSTQLVGPDVMFLTMMFINLYFSGSKDASGESTISMR